MRILRFLIPLAVMGLAVPSQASASVRGRDGLLAVQPRNGVGVLLVNVRGVVVRRICGLGSACGELGALSPRWSSNGQLLALSAIAGPVHETGVVLLYPDGTCLDCQPVGARDAAFTPDPTLYTAVSGGSLLEYGFDGIEYDNLLESGVTDAVWSSRGQLALVRGSSVWVGGLNGVRRLGPGSAPSWSPDGSRVALVRRGWITIVRLADHTVTRLFRGSSPAWSPDGRLIAFLDRVGRVRVIGVSGGAVRPVGNVRGRSIDWQPLPRHVALRCLAPPVSEVMAESSQGVVYEDGSTVPFQLNPPTAFTGCLKATGSERVLPVNTSRS